jgi:predicted nucleic acid-binding protein
LKSEGALVDQALGDAQTLSARYFGAELEKRTLLPTDAVHLSTIRSNDWLAQPATA